MSWQVPCDVGDAQARNHPTWLPAVDVHGILIFWFSTRLMKLPHGLLIGVVQAIRFIVARGIDCDIQRFPFACTVLIIILLTLAWLRHGGVQDTRGWGGWRM